MSISTEKHSTILCKRLHREHSTILHEHPHLRSHWGTRYYFNMSILIIDRVGEHSTILYKHPHGEHSIDLCEHSHEETQYYFV